MERVNGTSQLYGVCKVRSSEDEKSANTKTVYEVSLDWACVVLGCGNKFFLNSIAVTMGSTFTIISSFKIYV
jgi:hypothetical protein